MENWAARIEHAHIRYYFWPEELKDKTEADKAMSKEEIEEKIRKVRMTSMIVMGGSIGAFALLVFVLEWSWLGWTTGIVGFIIGLTMMVGARDTVSPKLFHEIHERYIFMEDNVLYLPRINAIGGEKFVAVPLAQFVKCDVYRPVRHSVNFVPVSTTPAYMEIFYGNKKEKLEFKATGFTDFGEFEDLMEVLSRWAGPNKVKLAN